MSIINSPGTPWVMLAGFCAAVLTLFFLAAGKDLGLLSSDAVPEEKAAVTKMLKYPIIRGEQKVVQFEKDIMREVGKALEHTGLRFEEWAEGPPLKEEDPASGLLLSRSFRLTDQGFEGKFSTSRPVSDPRVVFMSNPAIWVVDIPGIWQNNLPMSENFEQGFIRRVIIGEHEDYLRIVFHYRERDQQFPGKRPSVLSKDQGFIVSIPPVH